MVWPLDAGSFDIHDASVVAPKHYSKAYILESIPARHVFVQVERSARLEYIATRDSRSNFLRIDTVSGRLFWMARMGIAISFAYCISNLTSLDFVQD